MKRMDHFVDVNKMIEGALLSGFLAVYCMNVYNE